jgi:serine/threonine protein kinase, bacterial
MSSRNATHASFRGQQIKGKWHHKEYRILKELGSGANGNVFLVESQAQLYALKLSDQPNELALEYHVLKDLSHQSRETQIGPLVYELDDWEANGVRQYFFVMEYVKGSSLSDFVSQRGVCWIPVLISQILRNLEALHRLGYVFGDLKTENCLVESETGTVRLVDFGGVTPFGKGVRQFTEWYDRACWERGSRRADPGYDLFAVAMMVVRLLLPNEYKTMQAMMGRYSGDRIWGELQRTVQNRSKHDAEFGKWWPIVTKAWSQQYSSLQDMREDVLGLLKEMVSHRNRHPAAPLPTKRKRDWTDYWVWILFAGSFTLFLFFYFYGP